MQATIEKHYRIIDLAAMLGLSYATARRVFLDEPGVIKIANPTGKRKRRYEVITVPESVLQRFLTRHQNQ